MFAIALGIVACGSPDAVPDVTGSTSEDEPDTTTDADASSSTSSEDSRTTSDAGTSSSSDGASTTSAESSSSTAAESSESSGTGMCGDGSIDAGEECDNGENNGPTASCTSECTDSVCGDGYIREWIETCDDGPENGDGVSLCSADCRLNECGDGYVHETEACDLGIANGNHTSTCTGHCTVNVCGDGYSYWPTEDCDDGDDDDTDACTSTCGDAECGDAFIRAGEEECDDGAANGDGTSTCTSTCQLNDCGDTYLHASEVCDDGEATGDGVSECSSECQLNVCGDGYWLAAAEECDPGAASITCGDCTSTTVPVVDVSNSEGGTCVLFEPGVVRCFGNGRAADAPDLDLGGTVVQLAAGYHGCALMSGGDVRCWGYGGDGRLGYGNTENIGDDETPASAGSVDVGGLVTQIATGVWQSCAVLDGGDVRCWGRGDSGALGYGNTENIGDDETPASVGTVDVGGTVVQIAAGGHTCAVLDTGAVRCWGRSDDGQLGYANTDTVGDDETPASVGDVDVGGPVTQIAVGDAHTCAVLDTGSVRCWGTGTAGRLGYGNTQSIGDDETPASAGDVDVGGAVVHVEAGYHTCAILDTNTLRCWGGSSFTAQLGYGDYEVCSWGWCDWLNVGDNETPANVGDVPIAGDLGVHAVGVGIYNTCAVLDGGVLRCWGLWNLGYGDDDHKAFADENVPL